MFNFSCMRGISLILQLAFVLLIFLVSTNVVYSEGHFPNKYSTNTASVKTETVNETDVLSEEENITQNHEENKPDIYTITKQAMDYIYYIIVAATIVFTVAVGGFLFFQLRGNNIQKKYDEKTQELQDFVTRLIEKESKDIPKQVLETTQNEVDKIKTEILGVVNEANIEIFHLRAKNDSSQQQYREAISNYKKILDLINTQHLKKDRIGHIHFELAELYRRDRDIENAEEHYLKSLSFDTIKKGVVYYELASIYYEKDTYNKAYEFINKSIYENERNYNSWILKYSIISKIIKIESIKFDEQKYIEAYLCFNRAFGLDKTSTYLDIKNRIENKNENNVLFDTIDELNGYILEFNLENEDFIKNWSNEGFTL